MLSSDLKMFRQQFHEKKNERGELVIPAHTVELMDMVLSDCIDVARHLEASRVQRPVTLFDLKDPKIRIFPVLRRSNPVEILIRTPDDDGAA